MTDTDVLPSLIAALREEIDHKDTINRNLSECNARIDELESQILKLMKPEHGAAIEKMTAAGLTVFPRMKWRARYEPEKWPDIVRWAIDNDQLHIVQRRLTDSRVQDLIDSGVVLPDGLTTEAYPELGTRRG